MDRRGVMFVTLLCLCLHGVWGKILDIQPHFVSTCMITRPIEEFVNCSTHAVQILFNEIPRGIADIGLQVLDPLKIPHVDIVEDGEGPVAVNASLTDVTVKGFEHAEISYNSVDPETYDFYTKLRLPRLRIDGNYELLGRLLIMPLRGKGTCWFDASDLDITVKSDVIMKNHDGFDFFHVTDVHVTFTIGGLKLYLGNLFNGTTLEESTNAFLNANWKPVTDSLNPTLSRTIEDIVLDILQKVFDHIPANFFIGDIAENNKRREETEGLFKAAYFPLATDDPSQRIVGGQNASRNQFPYQISLQRRIFGTFMHGCGGSIISANWILTAAHCTQAEASNYRVVAGILLLDDKNIAGQQTISVQQIINHPLYPGGVAPNDISLIRLASALSFSTNVQPVAIPAAGHSPRGTGTLSGWGYLRAGGATPNHLQFVNLQVLPEAQCATTLANLVGPDNQFNQDLNICSIPLHGYESPCGGDSGGPYVKDGEVIGVVSWGLRPCGEVEDAPAVYVKTSAYTAWITTNTNGEVRP